MILQFVFGKTGSVALDVDITEFGTHEIGRILDSMARQHGGVNRVSVLPDPPGYVPPQPRQHLVPLLLWLNQLRGSRG